MTGLEGRSSSVNWVRSALVAAAFSAAPACAPSDMADAGTSTREGVYAAYTDASGPDQAGAGVDGAPTPDPLEFLKNNLEITTVSTTEGVSVRLSAPVAANLTVIGYNATGQESSGEAILTGTEMAYVTLPPDVEQLEVFSGQAWVAQAVVSK